MREAVWRDVGGGAERDAVGVQHGAFGHHLNLFFELAASGRAVDAAAAGENGVVAASPIDGVVGRGREEGEQPVGLQVRGWRGDDGGGLLAQGFGEIGCPEGGGDGLGFGWRGGFGFRRGFGVGRRKRLPHHGLWGLAFRCGLGGRLGFGRSFGFRRGFGVGRRKRLPHHGLRGLAFRRGLDGRLSFGRSFGFGAGSRLAGESACPTTGSGASGSGPGSATGSGSGSGLAGESCPTGGSVCSMGSAGSGLAGGSSASTGDTSDSADNRSRPEGTPSRLRWVRWGRVQARAVRLAAVPLPGALRGAGIR